ncbi:uncharacterized protein K460DRAFT_421449 [Cucurbitaria berberidis CBS 394.84]|uniref:Uncharacterized protein n=1 Tax=Cucurbitaria berberidis CBS 394.84 TaxID=1168544 RepID=A0A9P4G866_9PLEO|nr:uncharacterized protein K460DRAFT_421449 [Cucurbitaria berberidis CBS 394.84]KAF1840505.1 hypothetical protein K460DRAFT_421449 [Cucurbitaria berberidis CBS 394.84]
MDTAQEKILTLVAAGSDGSKASSQDDREAKTLRNQQESPFLRLPAELRNKIYGYVFNNELVNLYITGEPEKSCFGCENF